MQAFESAVIPHHILVVQVQQSVGGVCVGVFNSTIIYEYRPRGSNWALDREKMTVQQDRERYNRVIFNLFGKSPPKRSTRVPNFKMTLSGVTILLGSNFPFSY